MESTGGATIKKHKNTGEDENGAVTVRASVERQPLKKHK